MSTKTDTQTTASRLWPSMAYFFIFSAIAALFPFLALYYQSLGLTGGQKPRRGLGAILSVSFGAKPR